MSDYHPKGGMCVNCINLYRDCTALPFSTYPVALSPREYKKALKNWDDIPVICKEFVKNEPNPAKS